jgi:tetratricopeptide (TPR) repeat protein
MSTITLARIYERQGHTEDALAIYSQLFKNDPKNPELIKAIRRLKGSHAKRVSYFVNMYKKEQFAQFEKWLVKPWS